MVLSREDVQTRLKAEETVNWLELSLAAVENGLPPSLRIPAYALLNRDEQGKERNHGYDYA